MSKKFTKFLLLFAFSFLLIPASYWHHCDGDFHQQKSQKKHHAQIDKSDCFICDFEFQACEVISFNKISFYKSYPSYFDSEISEGLIAKYPQLSLRGPPNC